MEKIYKFSDRYDHTLSTELTTVYFYDLCKHYYKNEKALAHVVTVVANKYNQDKTGYFSLCRKQRKYKCLYFIESSILLHYTLSFPPLLLQMQRYFKLLNRTPSSSFRYLLRLVPITTNFNTLLLAVKILRHTHLISKIIKFARLYRFFKVLSIDIDVPITTLICLYNKKLCL